MPEADRDERPLPYGAVTGQGVGPGARSGDLRQAAPGVDGKWYADEVAAFRPARARAVAAALLAVAVIALVVAVRPGHLAVWAMYGTLLALPLVVCAEALYGHVLVDAQGITRRSLRGTTTYVREALATPVLHHVVRRSKSGRTTVLRLSIRLGGDRYGFMITSDLYRSADVQKMAALVGAARPTDGRATVIEQRFLGATRWGHRHPVLLALGGGAAAWLAAGFVMTWLIP